MSTTQERVVVSTFVALEPDEAFTLFTRDIDAWWRRSPRYRSMPGQQGTLRFEGAPPERLVESHGESRQVIGVVLAWQVGARLCLAWQGAELSAHDGTQVDVRFEAHRGGTRVTLEHKGLGALPPEHRARRGFSGDAFEAMWGYFWADLLAAYRTLTAGCEPG